MKQEDIELVRNYLVMQERTIASNQISMNAIREALIELLPQFQERFTLKREGLVHRSAEAAAWSDVSESSLVDQIIRILQDCG